MGRFLIVPTTHSRVPETALLHAFLFPEKKIISSIGQDNPWLPYFPKHLLCVYLYDRANKDNLPTLERLKKNCNREIRRIPADMLEGVVDNFVVKVAGVIQQRWAWIEQFINQNY